MKCSKIKYFHTEKEFVEVIYIKNSKISYCQHNHKSIYTIAIIIDGSLKIQEENIKCEYFAGDVYVVKPYKSHSIEAGICGYSSLIFCIKSEFVKKYSFEKVGKYIDNIICGLYLKNLVDVDVKSIIIKELEKIYTYVVKEELNEEYLHIINNIIDKNLENDMNVEELSQKLFISKYHFIRQFKKNIGITPHKFQIQNRIRTAQNRIRKGENINKVALDMGFYDQSHFIKYFKKIVGITPLEYIMSCNKMHDYK